MCAYVNVRLYVCMFQRLLLATDNVRELNQLSQTVASSLVLVLPATAHQSPVSYNDNKTCYAFGQRQRQRQRQQVERNCSTMDDSCETGSRAQTCHKRQIKFAACKGPSHSISLSRTPPLFVLCFCFPLQHGWEPFLWLL